MGERDFFKRALEVSATRRGFLKLVIGGTGLIAAGSPAIGRATQTGPVTYQGPETDTSVAEVGDLPPDEPAVDPDLVIEDEEMGKTLVGSFVGLYQRCFSQVAGSIHEYRANPNHTGRIENKYNPPVPGDPAKPGDKIIGPLPNRRFRLSAFNGRSSVLGRSTSDNGGAVNFNGEPNKGPALIIQIQSQNCQDSRIAATVTKLGEGELSKQALIPSGRLQRFPFFYSIARH